MFSVELSVFCARKLLNKTQYWRRQPTVKNEMRKTPHRQSGQKTFRNVSHDDSNQEDDSFDPLITHTEGEQTKGYAEYQGDSSDDGDEVMDFLSDGCVSHLKASGQVSDATHHSVVTNPDNYPSCGS